MVTIKTLGEAKYYHCGQEFSNENEICKKCEEYEYCSIPESKEEDPEFPF